MNADMGERGRSGASGSHLVREVLSGSAPGRAWLLALACGLFYGAVMGSFGGRWLQAVYSALKVPFLLAATVGLSLPSFFILNSLRGLRADFAAALRAIIGAQAGLTIVLASLAPLTAFWYASTTNYRGAILFNGLMFAVATFTAQVPLRRAYRPLIERDPRHKVLLVAWLVLYTFVGIQMGWVLRPFIGSPGVPTQLLRPDSWDNAYVIVSQMIAEYLLGRAR